MFRDYDWPIIGKRLYRIHADLAAKRDSSLRLE